jgi:hypothetical protein
VLAASGCERNNCPTGLDYSQPAGGFAISRIELATEGSGIDGQFFLKFFDQQHASLAQARIWIGRVVSKSGGAVISVGADRSSRFEESWGDSGAKTHFKGHLLGSAKNHG